MAPAKYDPPIEFRPSLVETGRADMIPRLGRLLDVECMGLIRRVDMCRTYVPQ